MASGRGGQDRSRSRATLLALLAALVPFGTVRAADSTATAPGIHYRDERPAAVVPVLTYRVAGSYQKLFAAELESGGNVESVRLGFTADAIWRPTPEFSAGVELHYEVQDWAFEKALAFGSLPPWDALERGGLSLPVELTFAPPFGAAVSPFVEWSFEREAGASDALTYGVTASTFGEFSPRLRLGAGATIHRQFFDTQVRPFLVIDWQLSPSLRVINSLAAGPLGPEGVELSYAPAPKWELAFGAVQRSNRFRLEPEGAPSGDIAEPEGYPVYARVTWFVIPRLRADLFGGVLAAARLQRWGPDGEARVSEDVATEPGLALVVSSRW